jgi:hypothetical protein
MAKGRRYSSRLARKEEARSFRQAIFFGSLTLILLFLLIFLGIPALIKMAIFIGEIRNSAAPVKTEDLLPPAPPVIASLPPATNSAQINLQGFAEAGTVVEIFLNGLSEAKLVTEKNGTFTTDEVSLTSGRNEIMAKATDSGGNTSQSSEKIIIFYDTTPPKLTISEPADQSDYYGDENQIKILGLTEEEATVTVNGRLAVVNQDGSFELPFSLAEGENQIKIRATDQAGNQTEKEITVSYSP